MENFEAQLIKVYEQTNQFGKANGMELINYEHGKIEYKMEVKSIHLATPTTAHGGVLAAYMDGIMGVAALTASAKNLNLVSTVEFKINYLKPAFVGDVLTGKGSIISEGKRIIIAKGEIFNQKGELISIATGTFNAYPYQKSGMVI
jgi:uncharacterized protein (TIGR00369 family)